MKAVGLFILKCIAFVTIFWSLWLFAFRPMNNWAQSTSSSCASNQEQNDSDALMKKYWEQAARADRLQAAYEQQNKQAAATLLKQDELLSRWEKVIGKWEKITPAK